MRITVFGANGPTGRLLTRQALAAGHRVAAVTRRPAGFPIQHDNLTVHSGDVRDPEVTAMAVAGADAVLSTVGVPLGRSEIDVYSAGAAGIIAAMRAHRASRLVCVSSAAVSGANPAGGIVFRKVVQPYVIDKLGRTTYADMRRLEQALADSDLDWTVVRPSGLFSAGQVTAYETAEGHHPSRFTAREDLADLLLRQAADDHWVRRAVAVGTVEQTPGIARLIWREAIRKSA